MEHNYSFDSRLLKKIETVQAVEYRMLRVTEIPYGLDVELGTEGQGTILRFFENSPNPFDLVLTTKKNYRLIGIDGNKIRNRYDRELNLIDNKYVTIEDFISFLKEY